MARIRIFGAKRIAYVAGGSYGREIEDGRRPA